MRGRAESLQPLFCIQDELTRKSLEPQMNTNERALKGLRKTARGCRLSALALAKTEGFPG